MFRVAKISGSKIVITFDDVGRGLKIHDGDKLDELRSRVLTENGTGLKPEL